MSSARSRAVGSDDSHEILPTKIILTLVYDFFLKLYFQITATMNNTIS